MPVKNLILLFILLGISSPAAFADSFASNGKGECKRYDNFGRELNQNVDKNFCDREYYFTWLKWSNGKATCVLDPGDFLIVSLNEIKVPNINCKGLRDNPYVKFQTDKPCDGGPTLVVNERWGQPSANQGPLGLACVADGHPSCASGFYTRDAQGLFTVCAEHLPNGLKSVGFDTQNMGFTPGHAIVGEGSKIERDDDMIWRPNDPPHIPMWAIQ